MPVLGGLQVGRQDWKVDGAFRSTQIGDALPTCTVYEDDPSASTNLRKVFGKEIGVLFGVPGAYTPPCSKTHLPGYIAEFEKLRSAGCKVIACVSVNDTFVMKAWGELHGAPGKVHMLADPKLELTRALGMELDASDLLLGTRCKRFSAIIQNGKFKTFNVERDGIELNCSLAATAHKQLVEASGTAHA